MKIVNTFQQSFTAQQANIFEWQWYLNRMPKTKPDNKYIVKIAHSSSSITALALNSPNLLFMSNSAFTGKSNTAQVSSSSVTPPANTIVNSNKIIILSYLNATQGNQPQRNQQTFIIDDIPTEPLKFNLEQAATYAPPAITGPTSAFVFSLSLMFYEVEGDIDITLDLI